MAKERSGLADAMRARAAGLPGTSEGIACAGTALESRTVQVRKKAFLFLGPKEARLKLRESLPEALHLAAQDPVRWRVGSLGWVAVTLAGDDPAVREVCIRWVEESWRLVAPQDLLESLAPRGSVAPAPARKPSQRPSKAKSRKSKPPKSAKKPAKPAKKKGGRGGR
jgi:hypothetical protein